MMIWVGMPVVFPVEGPTYGTVSQVGMVTV